MKAGVVRLGASRLRKPRHHRTIRKHEAPSLDPGWPANPVLTGLVRPAAYDPTMSQESSMVYDSSSSLGGAERLTPPRPSFPAVPCTAQDGVARDPFGAGRPREQSNPGPEQGQSQISPMGSVTDRAARASAAHLSSLRKCIHADLWP